MHNSRIKLLPVFQISEIQSQNQTDQYKFMVNIMFYVGVLTSAGELVIIYFAS